MNTPREGPQGTLTATQRCTGGGLGGGQAALELAVLAVPAVPVPAGASQPPLGTSPRGWL